MIMSDRDVAIGAHVTPEVKLALQAEARRRNMSMSAFIYEAIKEKLEESGVIIQRMKDNREVALPLEG
jgi:hypothetical protein